MKNSTRLLILLFTFVLAGCAPQARATSTPQPVQPISFPTLIPTATQPSSNAPLSDGLLLVRYDEQKNINFLSVVDPVNGRELTGRKPISLGQTYSATRSPDHKTLAAVVYKTVSYPQAPHDGNLLLISLADWSTRSIALTLNAGTSAMAYSPDGRLIAIADAGNDGTIRVIDVALGKILVQGKAGLPIRQLKFKADASALMAYCVPGDTSTSLTSGDPQVGLLKLADLSWQWSASLAGIRDGVYRREGKTGDLYAPGNAFFFNPGIAFAPKADILYIVNAEKDELTRVDFAAQTVETRAIHTEQSWFEQFLNMTATTVQAKGQDSNEKTLLISPDGQFLYVAGVKNEYTLKDNDLQLKQTPLGLQILRVVDAVQTGKFETTTNDVALSPDGKLIYLHRWDETQVVTDVFDIASKKSITSVNGFSLTPTQQLDGTPVLVSVDMQPNGKVQLAVFDPNSTTPSATWSASDFPSWLILP